MTIKKISLIKIIIFSILIHSIYPQYSSVRIAQSPSKDIPDNFLDRVIDAGYNYVAVSFPISDEFADEWSSQGWYYYATGNSQYFDQIKNAFVKVWQAGKDRGVPLQLIPIIPAGSKGSGNLGNTHLPIKWAPLYKVDMEQRLRKEAGLPYDDEYDITPSGCPSFAPDPEGYDKAFKEVIAVVERAFAEANQEHYQEGFPYFLDYIKLANDEPYTVDILPVDKKHQFFPGLSRHDKEWIYNNVPDHGGIIEYMGWYLGNANPEAKQMLIANELSRRVQDVHNAHGSGYYPFSKADIIVFADAWDPEKKGGYFNTTGVVDKLDEIDPTLKEDLVFELFHYDDTHRNITTVNFPDVGYYMNGSIIVFLGVMEVDATGSRYSPFDALDHFCSRDCNVMCTFALAKPGKSSIEISEKMIQVFKMEEAIKEIKQLYPNQFIGYSAATWELEDDEEWESNPPDDNYFNQYFRFNVIELASECLDESIPQFPDNSTYFGSFSYVVGGGIGGTTPSFFCDKTEARKLDYLVLNKHHLYSDIDRADFMKTSSFIDAIIYCNNLSEREELEPVYSFNLRVSDQRVYPIPWEFRLELDDIAEELENLTADFSKNGYRLLTGIEMDMAIFSDKIDFMDENTAEWVWVSDQSDPTKPQVAGDFYGWAYHEDGTVSSHPHNDEKLPFRVCRAAAPAAQPSITITGSGDDLQKTGFAKNLLTIENAHFLPGDNCLYVSGGEIHILPETIMEEGSEIHLFIDEFLQDEILP